MDRLQRVALAAALAAAFSAAGASAQAPRTLSGTEVLERRALRDAKRLERLARRPPLRLPGSGPVTPSALGCGMPCDSGQLVAANPFLEVLLECDTGLFGVRTGASHPATIAAGAQQDLLFDAAFGNAAGGRTAVFVHGDDALLDPPGGRTACPFDPPDTADEPQSAGLEQEWTVIAPGGAELLVRHELVAFGSGPDDAGVRFTLRVENVSPMGAVQVGLRWWLDPAIGLDDGPVVTVLNCEPFEELADWNEEHEFAPAEIGQHLRLVNDDIFGGEPVIEYLIATSAVAGFADSGAPDRLVQARWANAPDSPVPAWDYVTFEGDPTQDDVVLMLWHGYDPADATTLAPGESLSLSTLMLASCSREPGGCVAPVLTAAADGVPACPGDAVLLSASLDAPGVGDFTYTWTFGDGSPPLQVTDPTMVVPHVYDSPDFYRARLTASQGSEPGCSSFSQVDVDVVVGPPPTGELTDELRVARDGVDVVLTWPGSPVDPPSFAALSVDDLALVVEPRGWLEATRVDTGPAEIATDAGAVGSGPLRFYNVLPADETCGWPVVPPDLSGWAELIFDDMEADTGWIVDPDGTDDASTGIWLREDPNGTGYQVEDDHTPDPAVTAWITGNDTGGGDGQDDVDDGCTTLQSPVWDLGGSGLVRLSYWRAWEIGIALDDVFTVQASNDGGGAWQELEVVDVSTGGWRQASFLLDAVFGEPAGRLVLRFIACDQGAGSLVEAAVDDVLIEEAL